MQKVITICLVCVAFITAGAWGQQIFSFDENGNGSVNGTPLAYGVDGTLYYVLMSDAIPGDIYEGDVAVMEPGTTEISDVLRFSYIGGAVQQERVYVYSEREPGELPPFDLADTGIPSPLSSNVVYVNEVGTENGWNGVTYVPLSPQPGYTDGSVILPSVIYNFTSDVPEPATICLLAFGAMAILRKK